MKRVSISPIVLRSGYAPHGRSWYDDVMLYLADGDAIEATIDLTGCWNTDELVFSAGQDIAAYTNRAGARYYVTYTASTNVLRLRVMYRPANATNYSTRNLDFMPESMTISLQIDKDGLWLNGNFIDFIDNGESRAWPYTMALQIFNTDGAAVQIGSIPESYGHGSHAASITVRLLRGSSAPAVFAVGLSDNHASLSGIQAQVSRGRSLSGSVAADIGYELGETLVMMGGADVTEKTCANGQISIPYVLGAVAISAQAYASGARNWYSVTRSGSNVSFSNRENRAFDDVQYDCTVTGDVGYWISSMQVTMGGTDISSTAVSGNTISIAAITGPIVITATAEHETVLKSNYSPSGLSWTDTTELNYQYGDYIEAQIDISTCKNAKENILSIGQVISDWDQQAGSRYMLYYTPSSRLLRCWAINNYYDSSNSFHKASRSVDLTLANDITTVVVRADPTGLYVNNSLIGAGNSTYDSVRTNLKAMDFPIELGSTQGTSRSRATYSYIKVVRG